MISQFVEQSLKRAKYKSLEDGTHYADVPRLHGVWAQGKNLEECRQELREVIEEWLLLKIHLHDSVPGLSFSYPIPRSAAHA
jgi:predicted RNase H-like HicB family nuclease